MGFFEELLTPEIGTAALAGHIRPDGDSIGSVLALSAYIRENFPWIRTKVYLERPKDAFFILPGMDEALFGDEGEESPDLFITCDVSTEDRIGVAAELFRKAAKTCCIDHHMSNPGFAEVNRIVPNASSCAEILYDLFEKDRISKECAECLFTAIVHDTGAFQYANTAPKVFRAAADLLEKGVNGADLIDRTYSSKTDAQQRVLGYILSSYEYRADGRIVYGYLSEEKMRQFGAGTPDLEGVSSELRLIEGVQAAVFFYDAADGSTKVSLRSCGQVNVQNTALLFGGGGHMRAAGCSLPGGDESAREALLEALEKELDV